MPGLRLSSWLVLVFAAALTAAGCTSDTTTNESGSLQVNLQLEGDVTINQVSWVITGNGIDSISGAINTSAPGSTASVEVFGLPAGEDYLISMTATSADGETSCGGSAEFDVEVGVSTSVMVMLNCKPPQDLGGVRVNGKLNVCPDLVRVVVAPLQTSVGHDIELSATGEDYEGDQFEYRWEATGGSIDDPSATDTLYTCEEVGNHEVRVVVSDDDFNYCVCGWTVAITCVDGEDPQCEVDEDCGDGEVCTDGECVPDVECSADEDCADGEVCVDNVCVPDVECSADEDCADGDLCTVNSCDAGVCTGADVDCNDGNECTAEMCNPETGQCDTVNVDDGTPCDEANGTCAAGECKTNDLLGNDFVIVFEANYGAPELTLFLSGPRATDGAVSIAASGFSQSFSVTPGAVTTVTLPAGSEINSSDVVEVGTAVRVTADEQITVYGLNQLQFTTDAFAALPTEVLGQRHRVMAWSGGINGPSQLAIGAIPAFDGDTTTATTVTITPAAAAGVRPAGTPYTVVLNPLDAYQLQSDGDLTGTLIESDRPIAVYGGNRCANIPNPNIGFCDHVVEQIPPVSTWGAQALTVPLATRTMGDTFRILADQDGTLVQLAGESPESFTLNAGEFAQRILTGSYSISADLPILVAQYSNGTEWDDVTSDPFMMLIPSAGQFIRSYTFATPGTGFPTNFANIVALTTDASAGSVILDGAPVPAEAFTALAGSLYSAAQLPIAIGSHTVSAPNPMGLYVYGYASYDSYGYPGGFSTGVAAP
jgi:hypothetical protein